ncbi:GntR family transcriptional regulator [Sphingomonas spermidinifaciens]|nr:GntR family transcriptional regulator [Sphingomonas spermidinifaciens]
MERSYATLKQLLREGRYPPGVRLEASRIAEELGVSMTPVRDVLHRLVGERLVEASAGEGFHVPRLREAALRDLYEWHSALILMALRTARSPFAQDELAGETMAARTAQLFERFADIAPNREIRAAIGMLAIACTRFGWSSRKFSSL